MTRRLADAQGYRRGMVLGLTMAEIMLLLVFLMLLASAALLVRHDDATSRLAAEQSAQSKASETLAAAELARSAAQAQTQALEAALTEAQAAAARAEDGRNFADAALTRQVTIFHARTAELAKAQADLQAITGQNAQMRAELSRLHGNAGSGLPYCWTTPDGRPITALRVQLRDSGVIAQDPEPRPRADDPAWASLAGLPRNTLMPIEGFMAQTAGFVALSDAGHCRFAVDVIDGTSAANKPGYKGLMNRLWGSFLLHEVSAG